MQERTFGESGEAGGVGFARACGLQNSVVAGQLALGAEAALDPENSRAEREEAEGELLEEVDPVVVTAEMLHLVTEDGLQLGRRERGSEMERQQDGGREEADDAGASDVGRGAELDRRPVFAVEQSCAGGVEEQRLGAARDAAQSDDAVQQLDEAQQRDAEPEGGESEAPARVRVQQTGCVGGGEGVRGKQRCGVERGQQQKGCQPDE